MKHLQAEKDISSVFMEQCEGTQWWCCASHWHHNPPSSQGQSSAWHSKLSSSLWVHLQPPQCPQPRQPNLCSLPWYPCASRNLPSSLNPHPISDRVCWSVHRLTDPSCSRQALEMPIFLEELHCILLKPLSSPTPICIPFTVSFYAFWDCYIPMHTMNLFPVHNTSPPAPMGFAHHLQEHCQMTSPCCGSQSSQRGRQHSQEGRLSRSRSLLLQENWGAKGNR